MGARAHLGRCGKPGGMTSLTDVLLFFAVAQYMTRRDQLPRPDGRNKAVVG